MTVVTVLSALWLLRCAFAWGPAYDEWWHVWIGEARTWAHLWRELHVETHPPLSHLGVAVLSEPGDAIQWARLVAMVPAACTLPLWFATARRFGVSARSALVVVAVMGFAHGFAGMGVAVRGYALATAFLVLCLWGCAPYVVAPASVRRRDAWAAALGAVGAVWSIYTESLVIAAIAGALLLASGSGAEHRHALLAAVRRSWLPLVVAGLGGVAVAVYWRSTHIVMMQTYMPQFMPRAGEAAWEFLGRGLSSLVALFTVQPLAAIPWLAVPLAVAFVAGLASGLGSGHPRSRRFVAFALVAAVAQLFVAAMLRQLPFGGHLRHMYPLFPLLALGVALWLDLPRRWVLIHDVTLAAFTVTAVSIGVWSYHSARVDEFRSTRFDAGIRDALGDLAREGDTILTRRYGLIPLYVALRGEAGFDWRGYVSVGGASADDFTVRFAGRSLRTVVSLTHFAAHSELADGLLSEARALLEDGERPHILVLATSQPIDSAPTEAGAREVAARTGLRIDAARMLPEGVLLQVALAK